MDHSTGGKFNLPTYSIITPIIKLRYNEIAHEIFEGDLLYPGYAYRTYTKVEAWRISVLGSILTGVNCKLFKIA